MEAFLLPVKILHWLQVSRQFTTRVFCPPNTSSNRSHRRLGASQILPERCVEHADSCLCLKLFMVHATSQWRTYVCRFVTKCLYLLTTAPACFGHTFCLARNRTNIIRSSNLSSCHYIDWASLFLLGITMKGEKVNKEIFFQISFFSK
jgi:hypothetical protein